MTTYSAGQFPAVRILGMLILLFALNIHAQTFVGLPNVGVTLEGDVSSPTLVNTSGRTVLAHAILLYGTHNSGGLLRILDTRQLRLGLPPATNNRPLQAAVQRHGSIITQAVLDAVVFDDGQFVGPDKGNSFQMLAARIDGEKLIAQHVAARNGAIWDQLEAFVKNPPQTQGLIGDVVQHEQRVLAGDLLMMRARRGESAAFEMADKTAKHPRLWRAN